MENKKELTLEADKKIEDFNKYLQKGEIFNQPLTSSEKAIIKTYILWASRSNIKD